MRDGRGFSYLLRRGEGISGEGKGMIVSRVLNHPRRFDSRDEIGYKKKCYGRFPPLSGVI